MTQDLIFRAISRLVDPNQHPFYVKKDGTVVWTNQDEPAPVTQEKIQAAIDKIQQEEQIKRIKEETRAKIIDKKYVGPLESQATAGAALALMFHTRLCAIEEHLGINPTISERQTQNLNRLRVLLDLHAKGKAAQAAQKEIKND